MANCYVLVGAPAAGKSTWLAGRPGYYVDHGGERMIGNSPICSSDDVIDSVANRFGYTYDEVFQEVIKFADRVFWDDIAKAAQGRIDLYIDRTNMSAKGRRRYFDALRGKGYTFHAVVFPTPERSEWDRRLKNRPGKTIPKNVLESMHASFVMPTVEEGFATVTIVEPEGEQVFP